MIDDKGLDLITRTIIGEAENQPPEGWQAIAHVIKTRADSRRWGDPFQPGGLSSVVNAPGNFSVWNPGNARAAYARTVPANSPIYQRIAKIVQGVFSGQIPDNTGGATHFYNPKLASPAWAAQGASSRQIGDHVFMTLPLVPETTAGTAAMTAPAAAPAAAPVGADDAQAARAFLATVSAHHGRIGDTDNLNPEFAGRLAAAIKQARATGLQVGLGSGFREGVVTGSPYDMGGNSSHSYGLASDISGLDGPNGPKTQRWAQIAAENGLHNPYGIADAAEYNHWQLPEKPLEQTPALLASLKAAKASGDVPTMWGAYKPELAAAAPLPGMGSPIVPAATPVGLPEPDPLIAKPPGGIGSDAVASRTPVPVPADAPAAATTAGSPDVLRSMTTGVLGREPQYTALNLGGGRGAAPAPAAPAAPLSTPAGLANAPLPPEKPVEYGGGGGANGPLPPIKPVEYGGGGGANGPLPPPRPVDLSMWPPRPQPSLDLGSLLARLFGGTANG